MGEVALVARQDVALAGSAAVLDEQEAGGDVAGVDVREPAVDREAKPPAQVLLDRPRGHAVDVAGTDREPRVRDDHVQAVGRRLEGELLARGLGARVAEVRPAVVPVDHPRALVARVGRGGGRADGGDARDEDDSLDARRAAGGKGVFGPRRRSPPAGGRRRGRGVPRPPPGGTPGSRRRRPAGGSRAPSRRRARPRRRARRAGPRRRPTAPARAPGDPGLAGPSRPPRPDSPVAPVTRVSIRPDPTEAGPAQALGYPFELRRRSSAGRALHS